MKKRTTQAGALALACALLTGTTLPGMAAAQIENPYDEAYYATLDYYGALSEGSVVKSYRIYTPGEIVDYGTYDRVENLTDGAAPDVADGVVRFTPEAGSDRFYFEGKTAQPYDDLPWTISLSYRLNGVPTPAEELAGEKGLVEICLDVLPNQAAPEYTRTNLVLTAATAFNADDILSLEAEGGQVQLVGNLRAVLFAVLPGEERHFVIRVGTEDFTFSGMAFLAVPATLAQLDQIADLKEAKEEGEDSLDAISDSLDVILTTLEGMSGSLNATANGLDRLNSARGTVSAGKGQVYDSLDAALGGMGELTGALSALDGYSGEASNAVRDTVSALDAMNGAAQSLRPELENTRKTVTAIQKDVEGLSQLLTDTEGYNKRATAIASSLEDLLDDMDVESEALRFDLARLESALKGTKGLSALQAEDLLGMLPPDEAAQMKEVLTLHGQYEAYLRQNGLTEGQLSFEDFIVAGAYRQYCEQKVEEELNAYLMRPDVSITTPEEVEVIKGQIMGRLPTLEQFVQAPAAQPYLAQAKAAADAYEEFTEKLPMVDTVNGKIGEINGLITGLTRPTAAVVGDLSDLCGDLGDTGATDDLASLAGLCRELLKLLKEHEGEGADLLDNANQAGDILLRMVPVMDTVLEQTDALTGVLTTYEPTVQQAITDVESLSSALQTTLTNTTAALSAAEGLLKASGPALDEGTRASLSGISAALRKSTVGLDQTGTIRGAKDTITGLIDDQWDSHTGEVDGLLNMDPHAAPVSLTDSRNPAPQSVQYIMRTQEITKPEEGSQETAGQEKAKTTFWQRVKDLFKGIWADFTGLFHKKDG